MNTWDPLHWQTLTCQQLPQYDDLSTLQQVLNTLRQLEPLVTPTDCLQLQALLAKAGQGQAFILQGGDCAEMFADCEANIIQRKLKMLRVLNLLMQSYLQKPVIAIGRIAGQYAKPRSILQETRGELCLPMYRGDLINAPAFETKARAPDPKRLLLGYQMAAKTMQYMHDYQRQEIAFIQQPLFWETALEKLNALNPDKKIAIEQLISTNAEQLQPLFTSHEALLLPYEAALTRKVGETWYNASTHFPWIGMRTADPDGGHVAYARGLMNPIAVKIGPQMSCDWLEAMIHKLNPHKIPGHLTLIHRFGCDKIDDNLPSLINAAKKTGVPIVWMCDPMHGNTRFIDKGRKTRFFNDMASELKQAMEIHLANQSILAGIHLEITDDPVHECLDSMEPLCALDVTDNYKSLVDPRLNYSQTLALLAQLF